MIESQSTVPAPPGISFERELAPNVWLRNDVEAGQFVEIVMPPFEMNDLITECEANLPAYVIQVCQRLALREPQSLTPGTRLSPERVKGLLNTQILGTVLTRHQIQGERALQILPELQQAFGLAMQGRLRLTAHPVPDL